MWLGGGGDRSGSESRRLLGIRDCGSGCSGVVFLALALAMSLSDMDMNCRCMTSVMWSLMVVSFELCAQPFD